MEDSVFDYENYCASFGTPSLLDDCLFLGYLTFFWNHKSCLDFFVTCGLVLFEVKADYDSVNRSFLNAMQV